MKKLYVFLFFLMLIAPNLAGMIGKGETENTENRMLASRPELTGENLLTYPSEMEAYINDNAPFRSETLDMYAVFNKTLFHSIENPEVIPGKDGWMFYKGNGSVTDMLGIDWFNEEQMEGLLGSLLKLRSLTVKNPDDFVFYIAPNKEIIYRQYMPDAYHPVTDSSKAKEFVRYVREHSDIKVVYPEEILKEAARERQTYYLCDTHWNHYGGFLGARELLKALDVAQDPEERLDFSCQESDARGDLANLSHLPDRFVAEKEVEVEGYLDDVDVTTLINDEDGSGLIETVASGAAEARRLVMVRDSFGLAMMPPLQKNYQECMFIHAKHLKDKDAKVYRGDVFVYEIVERQLGGMSFQLDDILASFETAE